MFTLLVLYIVLYFYSFYIVLLFLLNSGLSSKFTQVSVSQLVGSLSFYTKNINIIFLVLFQLSGIPPFIFFFIKFYLLVNSIGDLNVITYVLIFLNILLGVFFYLRVFSNTSFTYSNEKLRNLCTPLVGEGSKLNHKLDYKIASSVVFFTTMNVLSCVFFSDIVMICM